MSLFQVTKKQVIENYELRTMTGDIVSFTPSYSQLLPDPFSDLNVLINIEATGGNGTPDNPNPINGYTEANITRCGANLFDKAFVLGQRWEGDGSYSSGMSDKNAGCPDKIPCKPSTTYCFVFPNYAQSIYMYLSEFDTSETHIQKSSGMVINSTTHTVTFTTGANTFYMSFSLYANNDITATEISEVGVNYPATDTTYHAYTGNTYTLAFGRTVYGGQLIILPDRTYMHVTHGKYTGTWGDGAGDYTPDTMPDIKRRTFTLSPQGGDVAANNGHSKTNITDVFSTSNALNSPHFYVYDNLYLYVPRTLDDSTPIQCSYVLATPFDIDLTPEVISAVVGTNNVYADCGDVTVKCLI